MANRGSRRQVRHASPDGDAANDDARPIVLGEAFLPQSGSPANDNPAMDDLPACLAITDDEVRLLHRYLGQQILALFG